MQQRGTPASAGTPSVVATTGDGMILRDVIASVPLAIIVCDLHGNVRLWSAAAERMFGWKAADIVGGSAARLMPRAENTRREDHLSPYLAVGGPRRSFRTAAATNAPPASRRPWTGAAAWSKAGATAATGRWSTCV